MPQRTLFPQPWPHTFTPGEPNLFNDLSLAQFRTGYAVIIHVLSTVDYQVVLYTPTCTYSNTFLYGKLSGVQILHVTQLGTRNVNQKKKKSVIVTIQPNITSLEEVILILPSMSLKDTGAVKVRLTWHYKKM